jgi:hypothetical protein
MAVGATCLVEGIRQDGEAAGMKFSSQQRPLVTDIPAEQPVG